MVFPCAAPVCSKLETMLIEQFEATLTAAQSSNNYLPFFSEGLQARFQRDTAANWSPEHQDSLKRMRKVLKVVRGEHTDAGTVACAAARRCLPESRSLVACLRA